jgi:hypothetical protein
LKVTVDGIDKTLQQQQTDLKSALIDMDKKFSDTIVQFDNDEKAAIARNSAS